eukprot:PhM_4_TR18760/c2_g1_i2/m.4267
MPQLNNPYQFQVSAPELFLVVVIDGVLRGPVSELRPTQFRVQKRSRSINVVVYNPTAPAAVPPNREVTVKFGKQETNIGRFASNGVACADVEMPARIADMQILVHAPGARCYIPKNIESTKKCDATLLSDIVHVFHDEKMNPSFGALRVNDLQEFVQRKNVLEHDLAALLASRKDFCHCYQGKDNEIWVVLHSHCKKVCVGHDNSFSYATLLQRVAGSLCGEEQSLGDLFRRVTKLDGFNTLLASNFTILKKFLIKHNTHFAWFQDEQSKTTKVVLHI